MTVKLESNVIPSSVQWLHATKQYEILPNDIFTDFNRNSILFLKDVNPLTPKDLQKVRPLSPLKIKIPSKHMREKPTNTPIIHSVY
jgi:hypothetical protein